MVTRVCWVCGDKAHHELVSKFYAPRGYGTEHVGAFECDGCHFLSIGHVHVPTSHIALPAGYLTENVAVKWYPERGMGKPYPDVPAHIGSAASEAHACHSIGSYRAAVLLARSVIEATAKDKGITQGNLASKIDEMCTQGFVRELVKETAHEIRHLGNDMAHGDFVDPTTEEESEEILVLMAEVLNEVYQAPARLEARKQARLAKQQAQSTTPPAPAGP
jgi:hypothetical protein